MTDSISDLMNAYSPVFDYVSNAGHDRIRAQLEGVLFQHLLILRRQAVQGAGSPGPWNELRDML